MPALSTGRAALQIAQMSESTNDRAGICFSRPGTEFPSESASGGGEMVGLPSSRAFPSVSLSLRRLRLPVSVR